MEKETIYSFSRLKTFNDCKQAYYLQYVLERSRSENIYSTLGTAVHEILELAQRGEITDMDQAVNDFLSEVEMAEFFGNSFPNEKIKEDYIACVTHAIRHFKPIHGEKFEIEKKVDCEIAGYKLTGFIDLIIHNVDGTVTVVDFKTSSKYSGENLKKNANQLLLYAIALEKIGYKVREVCWLMLKYCTVAGKRVNSTKTIKRSELLQQQEFEPCFVTYPLNADTKAECEEWVITTIEQIEAMDIFDEWESKKINSFTSFGCANVCSVCQHCTAYQKFIKNRNF
jgi:hypothetical protein